MKSDNFAQQPLPACTPAAHEEKILRRLFQGYPGGLVARLAIVASKRASGLWPVPLTPRDLYVSRATRRVTKRHSRNPSRAARDGSGQGRPFGKTGRPRAGSPIVNRSQA